MPLKARFSSHEALVSSALGPALRGLSPALVARIVERSCVMVQAALERCAALAMRDRQDLIEKVARLEAQNGELQTALYMAGFAKADRVDRAA